MQMQPRDLHRPRETSSCASCLQGSCLVVVLSLVYVALRAQPSEGANIVYEPVPALKPVVPTPVHVQQVEAHSAEPMAPATELFKGSVQAAAPAAKKQPGGGGTEHESMEPFAVLNRERKRVAGEYGSAFHVYQPVTAERAGGDVDDPGALDQAVAASAADHEVMLLCVGGSGSMRTGMNLVHNFRSMGLYNMLIFADKRSTCDALWVAMPTLACVYWPSVFEAPRPPSLYNTMFNKVALAFFEARKRLVERLVLRYNLNLLHLDADTIWFANPFPIFKTLYKDYQLIVQTDNPFVNAGIFYVQNVRAGEASAWFLQELNERIARFTYRPESVKELPNSAWSTPPHFANADEQANMNDIVASGLLGRNVYGNGVEFYEARFKKDKGSKEAAAKMRDSRWVQQCQQGDVMPARRKLGGLRPEQGYKDVVHLCKMSLWQRVEVAELRVPGNGSAPSASLLLAPEWLFSHFPYGAFFPSYMQCHADSWQWPDASALEQRLCMPRWRVPVVMVHMAGLRNGQWGRRGVMRALGVWNEKADVVAPEAWVSSKTDRLLVTEGLNLRFKSMAEFDHFAARLMLLGLLLKRRVVMPPMECDLPWARHAMEPRHLRGLEVGCGPDKQCVWLPMPHFQQQWCNGVDFIYDIDYRTHILKGDISPARDVKAVPISSLSLAAGASPDEVVDLSEGGAAAHEQRVLVLQGGGKGGGGGALDPFAWLPLDSFRHKRWDSPFAGRVRKALQGQSGRAGLTLTDTQLGILKDCMDSLATSKD
tara:strand:+ start:954 stop:3251 length:2298 start_codon:yes stop_codon:yes gene_type:complete